MSIETGSRWKHKDGGGAGVWSGEIWSGQLEQLR